MSALTNEREIGHCAFVSLLLLQVSDDTTWKLWSVPDCELIMSGEGHRDWVSGVDFHPHGTHLVTSSGDTTVKVGSKVQSQMNGKDLRLPLPPPLDVPRTRRLTGRFFFIFHRCCQVWDFASASCSLTFSDHTQAVWDVATHHTGDFVASCSMVGFSCQTTQSKSSYQNQKWQDAVASHSTPNSSYSPRSRH
jgi:WD40 repeat protein